MPRPTLAIVGTGVAGMGCAHLLHASHDLTVFEQADYVGGHTNTIDVPEGDGRVAFDTGFMVFNRVTYPRLLRLFEELKVPVKPTDMSFSVQHVPSGLEYSGSSLSHLFAQRRNLFRPRHYRMLWQVRRFNAEAVEGGSGKVGYLVEYSETEKIFNAPGQQATQDYVTGRFG